MSKEVISKWQERIEETFHGPKGIVGEKLQDLMVIEDEVGVELVTYYKGYVRLMDSFLDFYMESIDHLSSREAVDWSKKDVLTTVFHIATFRRFRASYKLFWSGYFIDGLSLLRAIFENVLQIVSVYNERISIDDVFGNLKIEDSKDMSIEEIQKTLRTNIFKTDKKVSENLIGKKSGLSQATQSRLEAFMWQLHNSVHKSKTFILHHYAPWIRGEKHMPKYPTFDIDLSSLCIAYSTYIGWMCTRILPTIQRVPCEFPSGWITKYKVLDESFETAVLSANTDASRAIQELVIKKLDFYDMIESA